MVDRVETVVVGKREVRFLIDQQADHVVLAFADGVVQGGVAFGILEVKWEGVGFAEVKRRRARVAASKFVGFMWRMRGARVHAYPRF